MTEDGEVADVAMFFASDHAKAVTGQHLMVNSGEMMPDRLIDADSERSACVVWGPGSSGRW